MAIDWLDVHTKAAAAKNAAVRIMQITTVVIDPVIAGRVIHPDTLNDLKTIDGPEARTAFQTASDELNAAMTT